MDGGRNAIIPLAAVAYRRPSAAANGVHGVPGFLLLANTIPAKNLPVDGVRQLIPEPDRNQRASPKEVAEKPMICSPPYRGMAEKETADFGHGTSASPAER